MMTPAQFYASYDVTDPFGSYKDRDPNGPGHLGSDFIWPAGTEIPSWVSGEVVRVGFSKSIGYYIVIRRDGGGYALFYHLHEFPPLTVGDRVALGQLIGLVGNTGTLSRGDHLHVGFSPDDPTPGTGSVVDPWPLILDSILNPTPLSESEIDMTQLNYIALVDEKGKRIKYGIFGQTLPGGCEIVDPKDITTAQAYGDLAGTRIYRPDNGLPVRVGAPLKDVQRAEWDALVVTSARLSRNYFAALGQAIAQAVKA